MLKKLLKLIDGGLLENPPRRSLQKILICSIALLTLSVPAIIHLLKVSNYPGELEHTQLGFDAEYIRECLTSMDKDEISSFMWGNIADYIFMVSYGCLFFSSSLLLARKLEKGSFEQKIGFIISLLGVISAFSDGFENVFILAMAFNPSGFPQWYAIPHSLFAHIKFKLIYLSSLWIALAIVFIVARKVLKSYQLTTLEVHI
jgi:hypothetical protein